MSNLTLHQNASKKVFEYAKWLRNNLTLTESILWEELRNKKLEVKFRRQHPIGNYVADFYCHELKFIVELDGSYHDSIRQKINDKIKNLDLDGSGCAGMRISDRDILNQFPLVMEALKVKILELKNKGK